MTTFATTLSRITGDDPVVDDESGSDLVYELRPGRAASWAEPDGGSQTLLKRTTNLSSAQILALHDTPVEVIPAPGVGKYILVGCISAKLKFETTPYTIGSSGQPFSGYEGQAQSDVFTGQMAPTTITSNQDHVDSDFGGWSVYFHRPVVENKAIEFFVKAANPAGGDGTLQLTYWYVVDDLP